ncbi:hypothetical protein HG531_004025 [Fusarium graminearum]|nr:hypothetical protein HG531_004025 [Fusarium graminearum]
MAGTQPGNYQRGSIFKAERVGNLEDAGFVGASILPHATSRNYSDTISYSNGSAAALTNSGDNANAITAKLFSPLVRVTKGNVEIARGETPGHCFDLNITRTEFLRVGLVLNKLKQLNCPSERVDRRVPNHQVIPREAIVLETFIPKMLWYSSRMGSPLLASNPPSWHKASHEISSDVIGVDNLEEDETTTWLQSLSHIAYRGFQVWSCVKHTGRDDQVIRAWINTLNIDASV